MRQEASLAGAAHLHKLPVSAETFFWLQRHPDVCLDAIAADKRTEPSSEHEGGLEAVNKRMPLSFTKRDL